VHCPCNSRFQFPVTGTNLNHYPNDPEFKTFKFVCDLVKEAGDRAAIVDLNTIAVQTAAASR